MVRYYNELLSVYKCFKSIATNTATPASAFAETMSHKRAALALFSCGHLTSFRPLRMVLILPHNFRRSMGCLCFLPSDRGKKEVNYFPLVKLTPCWIVVILPAY